MCNRRKQWHPSRPERLWLLQLYDEENVMKTTSIIAALSIATVANGCGAGSIKVPDTAANANDSHLNLVTKMPKSDDKGTSGMVSISDDVKAACGISDDEAYFAFNSANVRSKDIKVLDKLRTCFTTGKLKGHSMQLVGHADPRGDDSYNLALGGRRADSVKDIIVSHGMPSTKVVTSSRGEMDATGNDESTWAKDRRVDVRSGS
jgi:peptidoglycan-associated lipoprotein